MAPATSRILVIAVACTLLGCSVQRRYKVMSFFLDDVPDPNAPTAVASATESARPAEKESWIAGIPPLPTRFVEHPPVTAGFCSRCHDYSSKERGGPSTGFRLGTRGGSNLHNPIRRLCVTCHTQYSRETADEEGMWLHGPVGAGACTFCHDQHSSPNPRMLKDWEPKKLCLRCHNGERLAANEDHPPFDEEDCTNCHNPHVGDTRWLL